MAGSYTVDQWKKHAKYLIMVPYAQVLNMETGANVGAKSSSKQKEMYLKNCCVALVSAKHYNPEVDVALVTNIEVPQPYAAVLERAGVATIQIPFDQFNFGEKYTWGLAFYKLCAQYHISHNTDYEAVVCLDSDTCTQASYAPVWETAGNKPMFYRLISGTPETCTSKIFEETERFCGKYREYTHFGGEFFAASSAAMRVITEREQTIFKRMMETDFRVTTGDEFISSLVANDMQDSISFANDYVFRFWTGSYRSISPAYKTTLVCLHVPAEKSTGMIRLYDRYVARSRIPSKETVWRMLHIPRPSMIEMTKLIVKKIIRQE